MTWFPIVFISVALPPFAMKSEKDSNNTLTAMQLIKAKDLPEVHHFTVAKVVNTENLFTHIQQCSVLNIMQFTMFTLSKCDDNITKLPYSWVKMSR